MFRSTVVKNIILGLEMTKLSILSAMEYRVAFVTQVLGMLINNTSFIILWFIFFQRFPVLRGWTFHDSTVIFAISTIVFALVMIFCRGVFELARGITRGELDYYLSFPKNVLWHVAVSKTEISAIGDLLTGVFLFIFLGDFSIANILKFSTVCILGAVIFFNFIVITQSMAFYFGHFEEAAETLFHALLGISLYPQTVFHGTLKVLMMTIIPAYFMATLPVEIMRSFDLQKLAMVLLYAVISTILMIIIFNKGLKKYESGSLIATRT
jgi:ABC-2 type transport system permease protein